jgi:hypothetical protein
VVDPRGHRHHVHRLGRARTRVTSIPVTDPLDPALGWRGRFAGPLALSDGLWASLPSSG